MKIWFTLALLAVPGLSQIPTALQVRHIANISGSSSTCIDNRSYAYGQMNIHTFTATGTGTWSAQMQWSNTSCLGPWTSYGSLGLVNQASSPAIGFGFDGRSAYHKFLSFAVTGSGVAIDYAAEKNFFLSGGSSGTGSFTITTTSPIQGGPFSGSGTLSCPACEVTTNKDVNSGYAGLTAGGLLKTAEFPAFAGGDFTTVAGGVVGTLNTVNSNVGTFGDATHVAQVTVNGKGLVTAASAVAITVSLPGTVVQTNQTNTYGAFLNDFSAASLKIPNSGGAAPTTSALVAYDTASNIFKGGMNGSTAIFSYATGSAPVPGNCVQWATNYRLIDSGSANCGGGGGGGANTALSNLAAVSINISLLAQTGVDLGGTANPFRNVFLYGTGTYGTTYIKLTGAPTSTRTWTLQDTSDTFVGRATVDTLTGKSIDTTGAANVIKINGQSITNVSGNTSTIATTIGTLTPGHCPQFDANLNLVDSGSTNCGGGGGGGGLADPGANGYVVRTALNVTTARTFQAGSGITLTNPDGQAGNTTIAYSTSLIPTHDTIHANESFCNSTNGTLAMVCSFSSTKALTAYTGGMMPTFQSDATSSSGVTVNIDSVGIKAIKQSDGTTDPVAGEVAALQPFIAFYDSANSVFRLPRVFVTMRQNAFCSGTATSSVTLFITLWASGACTNTTEGVSQQLLMTTGGTIQNLRVVAGTAGFAAGSGVVTIRDNAANTTLTCTVGTGTSCNDLTHRVIVAAGHTITVQMVTVATETLANVQVAFEIGG